MYYLDESGKRVYTLKVRSTHSHVFQLPHLVRWVLIICISPYSLMYIFHLPLDLTMAGVAAGDDTIFHNYFFVHNILNVNTLCGRTTNYKRKQNNIMSNIKK